MASVFGSSFFYPAKFMLPLPLATKLSVRVCRRKKRSLSLIVIGHDFPPFGICHLSLAHKNDIARANTVKRWSVCLLCSGKTYLDHRLLLATEVVLQRTTWLQLSPFFSPQRKKRVKKSAPKRLEKGHFSLSSYSWNANILVALTIYAKEDAMLGK